MTWSFVAVTIVAVATPGADTAVVLRNASVSRPQAMTTVAGIATGQIIHTVAVVAGLAVVLRASAAAFEIVKL